MRFLVGPDDGHHLGGPFDVVIRVRSELTGGAMAVLEVTLEPGALIIPHIHQNDVWVHVLSGEIGVLVGEATASAPTGAWALKPRGVLHSMWNSRTEPARIIEILTPGGSERWFEETAKIGPDDAEAFQASCERHGMRFFPDSPWMQTLRERYGLQP